MTTFLEGTYQAVVIGAGHSGSEAALALSRLNIKTALLTLNLNSIASLACNPSIGGTAKGHLVREIDALGGEMGINADKTLLQLRMLNRGKGAAVHSLRAQTDKEHYHSCMKQVLENAENLDIIQGEAVEILTGGGKASGVVTEYGGILKADAVIVATGVYLKSEIIVGESRYSSGPSGFSPANGLTKSLMNLGLNIRRFKTGTPARIDGKTLDYSKFIIQEGEKDIYSFSFMTKEPVINHSPCYLTYTNLNTHKIIEENLHRSPMYSGMIKGTGARYCPSVEDKIVRFKDKERHQIFIEPEGSDTSEVYIQGMSTSMPQEVQKKMYRSLEGFENCHIMRYAYAIEYDTIDTLDLYATLEYKNIENLYFAGQVNGTSGYEEAAAQGLIAGINAALKLNDKPPFTLRRDEAYIGVLIDDLVTKGTDEPYRMMTSRAEYRLHLRQDNADVRLTEKGRQVGLVTDERYAVYLERKKLSEKLFEEISGELSPKQADEFIASKGGQPLNNKISYKDMVKRGIAIKEIKEYFNVFNGVPSDILEMAETDIRYEGYLEKGKAAIERAKKLEDKRLPAQIDYLRIEGLRIEARQKLNKIKPLNLGQAARISGVSPSDIAVLMVYLKKYAVK